MAEHKVIYAKCPYCKTAFPWINGFLSEYSPSHSKEFCKVCGKPSDITATQIIKFSAKKIKE